MTLLDRLKKITCFAFDVDGVLTDGSLLILDDGQMVRRMNIKDGYALQLAVKKGYKVIIISGGTSDAVKERLNKLGIKDVFLQVENKQQQLYHYMEQYQLKKEEVLFMGDDIPDFAVMKDAGLACCPIDAVAEIKSVSAYISTYKGGEGCARDVIEKVMKLRGDWTVDTSVSSK